MLSMHLLYLIRSQRIGLNLVRHYSCCDLGKENYELYDANTKDKNRGMEGRFAIVAEVVVEEVAAPRSLEMYLSQGDLVLSLPL